MDFLDKLFEKLPYDKIIPLPAWQRFAAMGFVIALFAGIFYYFPVSDLDAQIDQKNLQLSAVKKEVSALKSYEQRKDKLERQLARAEAELEEAKKILPTEKEIPSLLEKISNFGLQSGLDFQNFKPMGVTQKTEYYSEVPVDIEVRGRFHNVLVFFDKIAHLPRIVTIGKVQMQSGKDKTDPTNLTVELRAITYKFMESGAAAKGKDAKAGKK
ncbi:MAG: type 4a pilus biogenesis protein PilO [Nitrospinota bacterium]|nr:type 4a pilus biogenesis protein PilO [Nitrospinota bacterium]